VSVPACAGKTFGFIFQSYHLILHASATENVEVLGHLSRAAARPSATQRAAGITHPPGPGRAPGNKPTGSPGAATTVSIARALMNDAQIIPCDEPTGALTVKWQGRTALAQATYTSAGNLIIITHDAECQPWPNG